MDMIRRRFGLQLALVTVIASASAASAALAQEADPAPKAARLINTGDVLSGELNALHTRGAKINNDAQAAQLKGFIGKEVSVKVDEVSCAQEAGQMSEAVVTKWSVVTKH